MSGFGAIGVGKGVAAFGEIQASEAQAKSLEFNADVARRDAELARATARFDTARLRENFERFKGRQRAAIGASGTTFTGSPLLLIAEAAEDAELDALAIKFERKVRENAARARSRLAEFQADQTRAAGAIRSTATLLGG